MGIKQKMLLIEFSNKQTFWVKDEMKHQDTEQFW